MVKLSGIKPRPLRMRAALRHAIDLRVKQGLTIAAACDEAGMSPQGFHKAMKRSAVRDYQQTVQLEFVASIESNKAIYKARALEVGMDLMVNSKSEAVRARMVEFFAGDRKVSPVSVHIDARQPRGYEYAHPDQEIVTIRPFESGKQRTTPQSESLGSDTKNN